MIEEIFTDSERKVLVELILRDIVEQRGPDTVKLDILSKLTGTDTTLIARRAYPSLRPDR